jgi:hypothetical protein
LRAGALFLLTFRCEKRGFLPFTPLGQRLHQVDDVGAILALFGDFAISSILAAQSIYARMTFA